MLLEQTIFQLDIGRVPPERAKELAHLGYAQWLGALPGRASYFDEAMRAYEMARPFVRTSPAIAVFCELLMESVAQPACPVELQLDKRRRRGGAQSRRLSY